MPAKFLSVGSVMNIDGRQRVGIFEQRWHPENGRDEVLECGGTIDQVKP